MIALLAPGQGAQAAGMLTPWLALGGAEERIAAWSRAAGLDLRRLGTAADAEEIKDTAVTLKAPEDLDKVAELISDHADIAYSGAYA